MSETTFEILQLANDAEVLMNGREYIKLTTWYRCAIMEFETKLKVLEQEFSMEYDRNPFESIKTRLKSPESIVGKLQSRGYALTIESMEENLNDIAGIRVVCSFQEDIYKLARMLTSQDDVSLIQIKDYIKNPKPNGYRSLHLILAVPVFLSSETKLIKVEIQFRTIAMDFWASLEHKMKYKKNIDHSEEIVDRLKACAEQIYTLDQEMQRIRNLIEREDENLYL